MLSSEEIGNLEKRLNIWRETLALYLDQWAIHGTGGATPLIKHGINECRSQIHSIKEIFWDNGLSIQDHPDDELLDAVVQVEVIKDGYIDRLSETSKQALTKVIARILKTSPNKIRILNTRPGTIIFYFDMPKSAAELLLRYCECGDTRLVGLGIRRARIVETPREGIAVVSGGVGTGTKETELTIKDKALSAEAWAQAKGAECQAWAQKRGPEIQEEMSKRGPIIQQEIEQRYKQR